MNDPKRLLEQGGDDFEASLLRSVQGDGMSSRSRQRILTTLGPCGVLISAMRMISKPVLALGPSAVRTNVTE